MSDKTNSFLEAEKPGKLMVHYAIPCIISLLVAALYNIVDQIFIANADYLGSFGNAANTVVFPLTVVALAIATFIGDGCCAFVSISLGAGRNRDAHQSIGNAILLCIASSIVLTIIYLVFMDSLILAFGGGVNEETFQYSKEYLFWIALGIPFYIFGQGMNPIIRSDGSPAFAMATTLAGAAANIILDPIFIFLFHWGMMGAAVATVIGQMITAGAALWYMMRMKAVRLERSSFIPSWTLIKRFLPLGFCSILSQISLVAAMAADNNMIKIYSALDEVFSQPQFSQIPMAVVGIVMKFFQIEISLAIGLAAGCIPIVGYNMGAGRHDRVRTMLSYLIAAEAIIGLIALFFAEAMPYQLITIFGAAQESKHYTDFAIHCFRIYLSMSVLACINKGTFIFLQSIGKAFLSTLLSVLRELVFGVGTVLILPLYLGLDGVIFSMPVSDIAAFIISLALIISTYKALSSKQVI